MTVLRTKSALAALPLVAAIAGSSLAQQATPLPRSGEFTLMYTFVNPEPWAPIPRAADATGAITATAYFATNVAWLLNAVGSGFGHQMTGRCGTLFLYEGTTLVQVHTNCVYTDRDGDMIFETVERNPGDTVNTGQWTGGTGKYAGITGTFTVTGAPGFGGRTEGGPVADTPPPGLFPGVYELYAMSAGTKVGSYTLPSL
jgi:hypothetical protein